MAKKRGPNEGTITRRADGRWMGRLSLGYGPDGKRIRKTFYGKTYKEVLEKMNAARRDLDQGLRVATDRQTVGQFLVAWLEGKHALADSTRERYGELITHQIAPAIGRLSLAKLQPQDLSQLYANLLRRGLAPQTVHHVHTVLHGALKQAVRLALIARSPAQLVDPPRVPHHETRPLDGDEIRCFLAAARDDRYYPLYLLCLVTGMRLGELLGLKWSDIDFKAGALTVQRQARPSTGAGIILRDTKTGKSRRSILLPQEALVALQRHRTQQLEARLLAGPRWHDLDLVFPNGIGKPLRRTHVTERSFKKLLQHAGLRDIRFHDLRHSAATLLMAAGVHPKIVQERLGHANIGITLDIYSHVLPTMQREVIDTLDRFLRDGKGDEDDDGAVGVTVGVS